MKKLHLFFGGAGLVLFIFTGQYMVTIADVPNLSDSERMLYRANHIYLMMAFVLNIAAGYFMPTKVSLSLVDKLISTGIIMVALVLSVAFFIEPATASVEIIDRMLTRNTLILLFGLGALMLTCVAYGLFKNGIREIE